MFKAYIVTQNIDIYCPQNMVRKKRGGQHKRKKYVRTYRKDKHNVTTNNVNPYLNPPNIISLRVVIQSQPLNLWKKILSFYLEIN